MKDLETQIELNEQEHARRLVGNDDWKWAKDKLLLYIDALMNLETMGEFKTATSIQNEILARKKAKGLVKAWLEEVDGLSVQHEYNKEFKEINEDYIVREE